MANKLVQLQEKSEDDVFAALFCAESFVTYTAHTTYEKDADVTLPSIGTWLIFASIVWIDSRPVKVGLGQNAYSYYEGGAGVVIKIIKNTNTFSLWSQSSVDSGTGKTEWVAIRLK